MREIHDGLGRIAFQQHVPDPHSVEFVRLEGFELLARLVAVFLPPTLRDPGLRNISEHRTRFKDMNNDDFGTKTAGERLGIMNCSL